MSRSTSLPAALAQSCALALVVLGMASCTGNAPPRANVEADAGAADGGGSGDAELSLDRMDVDFGSVTSGEPSEAVTLTITNRGPSASGAPEIALRGRDAASFVLEASACAAPLAAGASCALLVRFAPSASMIAGAKNARVEIVASPGGTLLASLEGEAIAPGALSVTVSGGAFGKVVLGTRSEHVATITVTNRGGRATGALTVQASGSDPQEFAKGADDCSGAPLEVGASCTFEASFAPSATGAKAASFEVSASPGGKVGGAVSGIGIAPARLVALPLQASFGTVDVGGQSAAFEITVSNAGDVTSGSLDVVLAGPSAGSFTTSGCDGTQLVREKKCKVLVQLAPSSGGPISALLTITALPGGRISIPLLGTAVTGKGITLSPTPFAFAPTRLGEQSSAQTFTVHNRKIVATGTLHVSLGGSDPDQFQIVSGHDSCDGSVLATGGDCSVQVVSAPGAGGTSSAELIVTDHGLTAIAAISGSGVAPAELQIAPASKSFGSVAIGAHGSAQTLLVTNVGGTTSGKPELELGGAGAAQFELVGNGCTAPLAAGGSCPIKLRFAPALVGPAHAQLQLSASPGGSESAALDGDGIVSDQLSIDPSTFAFRVTNVGDGSAKQTFTVHNGGSATTGMPSFAKSGAQPADFSLEHDCGKLAPGATCTLTASFVPRARGARSATVTVSATPGGRAQLALAGEAEPRLEIVAINGRAPIDPYAFGSQVVGTGTSDDAFVTLRSHVAAAKTFGVTPSFGSPAQLLVISNTCAATNTISAHGTCTVGLRFAPTTAGAKTGKVTFAIGDGAENRALLGVTGKGIAANDEPPTNITFSASPLAENQPALTLAGTFTTTDTDVGETFTYALVSGAGDTDNAAFASERNTLVTAGPLDFETKSSFSIRVRSADHAGLFVEKAFTLTLLNADDAPTAVADATTLFEGSAATAVDVLINDGDIDGGPKRVASVTQPANGAVTITGSGSGLTYRPNPGYCNDPPGTALDTFNYTLNGGSTATVSVTVTCFGDAPDAGNDADGG